MATAKYGLEPIGPQKPDALVKFDVDPSNTAIYRGDVVQLAADKGIAQAEATNVDNIGVVVGFYDADGLPALYYPAGSAAGYTAIVNIDPHQLYKIHYYHESTALDAAYVGSCADWVVGTGNTTTGQSGAYVTALASTAAGLYVLGLYEQQGNEWGTDCELVVKLHEHVHTPAANGI
jgi:hypothetical protein